LEDVHPNLEPTQLLPEQGELLLLIRRIGASRHFRRAQRLRSFLEFVCQQTLAGNAGSLHEQLIGERVFRRPEDYDPAVDNIVRVEARELRKRLEAYFADEGAGEPIVIRVPKGGYIPVFETSSMTPAVLPSDATGHGAAPPLNRGGDHRFLIAALATLVMLLAGLNVYQRLRPIEARGAQPANDALPPLLAAFWSRVFEAGGPTLLCLADSNLSLLQDLRGESISFTDYTSGRYFASLQDQASNAEAGHVLPEIASRYYTSIADASTLARLMMLNRNQGPVEIRFARDLNIRDLKSRNAILLGSSRSNPWVGLLDKKRRFRIEHNTALNRAFLSDSSPESGKPSVYMSGPPGERPYDAYGIVATVRNLDGTGHAILISGTNMQGTEAAGEFLTNVATFHAFLKQIGWHPDLPLPVFEVVLQLVTVGGSSTSSRILAYDVPEG